MGNTSFFRGFSGNSPYNDRFLASGDESEPDLGVSGESHVARDRRFFAPVLPRVLVSGCLVQMAVNKEARSAAVGRREGEEEGGGESRAENHPPRKESGVDTFRKAINSEY